VLGNNSKIQYKALCAYTKSQRVLVGPSLHPAPPAGNITVPPNTSLGTPSSPSSTSSFALDVHAPLDGDGGDHVSPTPHTPAAGQRNGAPRLLSRLKKRKVDYEDVSPRVKQKVARALTTELCEVIEKKVAVDNKHITHAAIMRTCADSAEKRSGSSSRPRGGRVSPASARRRALAADPLLCLDKKVSKSKVRTWIKVMRTTLMNRKVRATQRMTCELRKRTV